MLADQFTKVRHIQSINSEDETIEQMKALDYIIYTLYNHKMRQDIFDIYAQPFKKEAKKAPDDHTLQCCAYVIDNHEVRQCRNTIHSDTFPFLCKQHLHEYETVKREKEDICKQAEELNIEIIANLQSNTLTKAQAKAFLKLVYGCLEYRVRIIYRYFHPGTNCERRLRGHLRAINWFDEDVIRKAFEVAIQSEDSKKDIKEEQQEDDSIPLAFEAATISASNIDIIPEHNFWESVSTFALENNLNDIQVFENLEKSTELLSQSSSPDIPLPYIIDTRLDKLVLEDGSFHAQSLKHADIDDDDPEKEAKIKNILRDYIKFKMVFAQNITGEYSPWCMVICRKIYDNVTTNKPALQLNIAVCLFRLNNLICCGYWKVANEKTYKAKHGTIYGHSFLVQPMSHLFQKLAYIYEGEKVTIVGLIAKPELNGEIGILGKFEESSGRYQVSVGKKIYKLKYSNIQRDLSEIDDFMLDTQMRRFGNIIACDATLEGIKNMKKAFVNTFTSFRPSSHLKPVFVGIHEILHGKKTGIEIFKTNKDMKIDYNSLIITLQSAENINIYDSQINHQIIPMKISFKEITGKYKNKFSHITDGRTVIESRTEEQKRRQQIQKDLLPKRLSDLQEQIK